MEARSIMCAVEGSETIERAAWGDGAVVHLRTV